MTKRTDRHAPSNLNPSEYTAVLYFSYPSGQPGDRGHAMKELAVLRQNNPFWDHPTGLCAICGVSNYLDGGVFRHDPSGEMIQVGHICADKVDFLFDRAAFLSSKGRRKAARLAALERAARLERLTTFVKTHATDGLLDDLRVDHHIIQDIRSKVALWGLSEAQIALVRKIAADVRERAANELPTAPVPTSDKRVRVEGKILSVQTRENTFSGRDEDKMLVQVEVDGAAYKLWGTAPSALFDECQRIFDECPDGGYHSAMRGRMIAFDARVERSDKDESFGFFKRPTKVALV